MREAAVAREKNAVERARRPGAAVGALDLLVRQHLGRGEVGVCPDIFCPARDPLLKVALDRRPRSDGHGPPRGLASQRRYHPPSPNGQHRLTEEAQRPRRSASTTRTGVSPARSRRTSSVSRQAVAAGDAAAADTELGACSTDRQGGRRAPCTATPAPARRPGRPALEPAPEPGASAARRATHGERQGDALRIVRAAPGPPLEVGDRAGRGRTVARSPVDSRRTSIFAAYGCIGSAASSSRCGHPHSRARRRARLAQALGRLVDRAAVDRLACSSRPLGGGERRGRVAVDDRVRSVQATSSEVSATIASRSARVTAPSGPAQRARRSSSAPGGRSTRPSARPSSARRRVRARSRGTPPRRPGHARRSRAFGAEKASTAPPASSTASASFFGAYRASAAARGRPGPR